MKNIKIIRVLFAIVLFFMSSQSFGFWLFNFDGSHQNIMARSARKYIYSPTLSKYKDICENDKCYFSDAVINILKNSNNSIDLSGPAEITDVLDPVGEIVVIDSSGLEKKLYTGGEARFHCDEEEILDCSMIIYNGRKMIVNEIASVAHLISFGKKYESISNRKDITTAIESSQKILGNISHTLQDFYSHSNWVEKHLIDNDSISTPYNFKNTNDKDQGSVVPTYKELINGTTNYAKKTHISTCHTTPNAEDFGQTFLSLRPDLTDGITSGYYADTPDIYGFDSLLVHNNSEEGIRALELSKNGPYYSNWSFLSVNGIYIYKNKYKPDILIEKCQHGNKFNSVLDFKNNHFGIAKDSSVRRHHKTAKSVAEKSTIELIKAIVDDVSNSTFINEDVKYTEAAILLFLGYDYDKVFVSLNKILDTVSYLQVDVNSVPIDYSEKDVSIIVKDIHDNIIEKRTSVRAGIHNFDVNFLSSPFTVSVSRDGYEEIDEICGYEKDEICKIRLNTLLSKPVITEINNTKNGVVINWNFDIKNNPETLSGYEIYKQLSSSADWVKVNSTAYYLKAISNQHEPITGLETDQYVSFKMRAYGKNNLFTAFSEIKDVWVDNSSEVFSRPIISVSPGNSTVEITWEPVLNAVSYTLYYGDALKETSAIELDVKSPYMLTGLKNGLNYRITVVAINVNGEELYSDEIQVRPKPNDVATSPLNDTGITWGRGYPKGNIACTEQTIQQQDCSYGRDASHNDDSDGHAGFSFTKLDENGDDLPALAQEWSCVRDNTTKLIWEAKTASDGIHNAGNRYAWGGGSRSLVDGSNTEELCGFSDWRVPTIEELIGIVDFSRSRPTIDTNYFPYTVSGRVWSSTLPVSSSVSMAWCVSFYNSDVGTWFKNSKLQVRLVRSITK